MEIKNNSIIADSSALVSLIDENDINHRRAIEEAKRLEEADRPIMLPGEVLAETINILGKKFSHGLAVAAAGEFLRAGSQYFVVETSIEQLRTALVCFHKQKESVSFTDCIVMIVADVYGTKDIFGFDKQFEEAGYDRLQPAMKKEAA